MSGSAGFSPVDVEERPPFLVGDEVAIATLSFAEKGCARPDAAGQPASSKPKRRHVKEAMAVEVEPDARERFEKAVDKIAPPKKPKSEPPL